MKEESTKLLKQKLKLRSCKNNLKSSNQNSRLLPFKIKNYWLFFKRIKKMPMPRNLFAKVKKDSATFKEMRLML